MISRAAHVVRHQQPFAFRRNAFFLARQPSPRTTSRHQTPWSPLVSTRLATLSSTTTTTAVMRSQQRTLWLPRQMAMSSVAEDSDNVIVEETVSISVDKPKRAKNSSMRNRFQLVIVESPTKAKTLQRLLDKLADQKEKELGGLRFKVEASMGHVRDLPSSASQAPDKDKKKKGKEEKKTAGEKKSPVLGVDIYNAYQPQYIVTPKQQKTVHVLRQLATDANCVGIILATDADREGEAIAWHLSELLNKSSGETLMSRVTFNEITATAIEEAFFSTEEPVHDEDTNKEATLIPNDMEHNGHSSASSNGVDMNLVEAQETRRVLDRLAGYSISPVLWAKISPGLSAGRVQSVGMALVVNRERDRMAFRSSEYWDLTANLSPLANTTHQVVNATLASVNGIRVATGSDFDGTTGLLQASKKVHHLTDEGTQDLMASLGGSDPNLSKWTVQSVQSRSRSRSPPLPFTTSTLQQEANKRLRLSVSDTMRCAQSLYEAGFISYMRTDSTEISQDAVAAGRQVIQSKYGADSVSPISPNVKSKGRKKGAKKFAQEAHEAIRPAIQNGKFVEPSEGAMKKAGLSDVAIAVSDLIFKRTVASMMTNQISNETTILIDAESPDGSVTATFRVGASVVVNPGFTRVWDNSDADSSPVLSFPLEEGDELHCNDVRPQDHYTQPPPRYSEASFVKELEALEVGRPSTYATVVQTLRDRGYVGTVAKADRPVGKSIRTRNKSKMSVVAQRAAGGMDFSGKGQMTPSLTAFVVCSLLEQYCPTYVDPSFTATMEKRLDLIAKGGADDRVAYLDDYYGGDEGLAAQVDRIHNTVDAKEVRRARLPWIQDKVFDREEIGLFVGPWGPYLQRVDADGADLTSGPATTSFPGEFASDLSTITPALVASVWSMRESSVLGVNPQDGRKIFLKFGKYGAYLQRGEDEEEDKTRHSLPSAVRARIKSAIMESYYEAGESMSAPSEMDLSQRDLGITMEEALGYISLPRTVCTLNELPIVASIGPYGPYLKYNNTYASLTADVGDVLTIGPEAAVALVTEKIIHKKKKLGRGVLAEVGTSEGSMIRIKEGKFGRYLQWKSVNMQLPPKYHDDPSLLSVHEAWELIQEGTIGQGNGKGSSKNKITKKKSLEDEFPPRPKRPKTAYLHFCEAKRPQVAESVKSLGEVSKELARLWALAGEEGEGRAPYEELAEAERMEYEEKRSAWQAECDRIKREREGEIKDTNPKTSPSLPPPPKRPLSAYFHFCAEKRPEVLKTGKSLGEASKELAKLWALAGEEGGEGRARYEELAAAEKMEYEKKKSAWQAECDRERRQVEQESGQEAKPGRTVNESPLSGKSTSKTKASSSSSSPAPKKPLSAYFHFCAEKRPHVLKTEKSLGDASRKLSELWAATGEKEREPYVAMAAQDKERYEKELSETASPGKPRRAPSAYMLFCQDKRKEVVAEDGSKVTFGQAAKRLAEMWKTCDENVKALYHTRAAEEKEKLQQEPREG